MQPVTRGERALNNSEARARNRCVANFEPRGVPERVTFYSQKTINTANITFQQEALTDFFSESFKNQVVDKLST